MYFKETGDNINVPAGILGLVLIIGWIGCASAGCYKSIQNHRARAKARAAQQQTARPTAIEEIIQMGQEPASGATDNVLAEEIKALTRTNSVTR